MSKSKKQWRDLTSRQKAIIVVGGALEVAVTAVALADLTRRPASDVRGPKWCWAATLFVQPVGPIAYLTVGRKS